ncbi:DUF4838 domain-containing protein [bacterium]|nr:DUF4838 domain-containing protein [bacterium]
MTTWCARGCALAGCMLSFVTSASGGDTYRIVDNGKPSCSIVTEENPTPAARLAALEIQFHVFKSTGVEIPIHTDKDRGAARQIMVGESERTRELGFKGSDFKEQEYAIARRGDALVLIGRDWHHSDAEKELQGIPMSGGDTLPQTRHRIHYWKAVGYPERDRGEIELPGVYDDQGTCLATYDFLERYLGVRWYGPNQIHVVIPKHESLDIEIKDIKRSPALKLRCGLAAGNWPFMQRQWGSVAEGQVPLFWRRLRLGGERWSCNHTFHRQTVSTVWKNPEYQCKNPAGKGSQLCYTNRKLVEDTAQMARDYFDGKNNLPAGSKALGDYFAIVPDDNSNFCNCKECRSLLKQGSSHHSGCFNSGDASNYWFSFVNAVAREVRKTHPNKYIATLGYWLYALPPDFELEPNVSIAPCMITCAFPPNQIAESNDMGMYRQWLTKTKSPMFMWVYYHHPMEPALIENWKCFPHIMVHATSSYMREFISNGLRGMFVCGEQDQLEFYVMTKVWDDPDAPVDTIIDEFFHLYFGAASTPMKKFYLRLEEIACDRTNYPPESQKMDSTKWRMVAWKNLGTAERMEELGALMVEAEKLAMTPEEKERVVLWRHAFWDWMAEGRQEYLATTAKTSP